MFVKPYVLESPEASTRAPSSPLPCMSPTVSQAARGSDAVIQAAQKVIDFRLRALEQQIEALEVERRQYAKKKLELKREVARRIMGDVPLEYVVDFCTNRDVCNFSATNTHNYNSCSGLRGGKLVAHIDYINAETTQEQADQFVSSLCASSVRSITLNAKPYPEGSKRTNYGVARMIKALAKSGKQFPNITSLTVNAAAQKGELVGDLLQFVSRSLRPHQLRSVHLSGLSSLAIVGSILSQQNMNLTDLRLDYFVAGHERDIVPEELPVLPKIQNLIYDVADVTELSADLLLKRLESIEDLSQVARIYLPHVQIAGESDQIARVVSKLGSLTGAHQIVMRFAHMPLSVKEIVDLRQSSLSRLPAVCISDHFIVAMDSWAEWWPKMTEVWKRRGQITGLSVFREQIDFEALGTSATREWLRLSPQQKRVWTNEVRKMVAGLYTDVVKATDEGSSGNASLLLDDAISTDSDQ